MPQVVFRHVGKTYPDGTTAVTDLNLTIEDGELLCVLGPSGCGKSSTLRMLAGLESISLGDLLLDGQRINDVPPQARDMAMVFENYALYPHLKVFDNIAMPLVARGLSRGEIRRRVEASPRRCRSPSICASAPTSFRAASASGWRSGAPSCARPECSSWTSHSDTSRPISEFSSGLRCAVCTNALAPPPSTSRMIRRRPRRSLTASP